MTHTHAKGQDESLLGSKDEVEMDGRTDGGDCNTSSVNEVGN